MTAVNSSPEREDVPDVSVIMAVYNTMPYLTDCLRSLVRQTIGHGRLEIIAVNDGSTDDSPTELAKYAARYPSVMRVVHQENSGGPARPTNRGLEMARGRYVFFIGSDDYLGPEALARLVAAGDEHDADVVAGRMVGVGGRYVPLAIFSETNTDVNLFDSELPFAMSNTKLFRRSLLESHGIRYSEDLPMMSDQLFTVAASVRAKRIVVMADYDYYYAVKRPSGGNITYSSGDDVRLSCTRRIMDENARLLEPGPRRDTMMRRNFTSELGKVTRPSMLKLDRAVQERLIEGIGDLADRYLTESVRMRLDVGRRLRLSLAQRRLIDETLAVIAHNIGKDPMAFVRDETGLYADYPFFRDERGLPDAWFFVTDKPHEMVAHQLSVEKVQWVKDNAGRRVLKVFTSSPFAADELKSAGISATVGNLKAKVRIAPAAPDASTSVVFEWQLRDLVAIAPPFGGWLEIVVGTSSADEAYRVALRLPGRVRRPKQLARFGPAPMMIRPIKLPEREFALEFRQPSLAEVSTYVRRRITRKIRALTKRVRMG